MITVALTVRAAAAVNLLEGAHADRLRRSAIEMRQAVEVVPPGGLHGWHRRRAARLAGSARRPVGLDG